MNRPGHIVCGICAAAIIVTETKGIIHIGSVSAMTIVSAPFAVFGSYLPDIDVKRSNMRKNWKSASIVAEIISAVFLLLCALSMFTSHLPALMSKYLVISFVVFTFSSFNLFAAFQLKHRTFTHSWYFPLLFYEVMYLITIFVPEIAIQINSILFGVFIGFTSHLIADSFTTHGTYLAYPIPIKIAFLPKFMRIKTGTKSEKIFIGIIAFLSFAVICIRLGI